ncbi:MAG: protein kinase [Myxococcales bacterium]|nr:protein kinase [Myxococcales bacterium]
MSSPPKHRPDESPTIPVESLVGTTLAGRYKIEALLGEGGMGAVYLAQHVGIRKRVAIKVLHPETSQNPELVARFEREAIAAAHVEHPNITAATDFGRAENGQFFLALEYLEGKRLRDVLGAGPMPALRAIHIIEQVASALERSHQLGVIHRDLKPENIMLVARPGDPDFVKVLDFGLAKVVPAGEARPEGLTGNKLVTQTGSIFGTPRYMPPEQCVGGTTDGRSDLYSLGLVLYEMLAGVHPIAAKSTLMVISHQLATPTPPMKQIAPAVSVPAALEAIVMRLTEKPPENRYPNATALLAALKEARAQLGLAAGGESSAQTAASATPASMPGGSAKDAKHAVAPVLAGAQEASVPTPPPLAGPSAGNESAAAQSPDQDSWLTKVSELRMRLAASRLGLVLKQAARHLPLALQKRPYLLSVPLALSLIVTIWILRAGQPTKPRPSSVAAKAVPVSQRAPAGERQQALNEGIPALLSLVNKYPNDPAAKRTLAMSFLAQQQGIEALRWLAKAASESPGSVGQGEVQQACLIALSTPDTVDTALQLLETGFGTAGIDVLYALAVRPGPIRLKARFRESLSKPQVRALASPATQIAIELRFSEACEEKRGLLPRAAQAGDARLLPHLKSLLSPRNCGPYGLLDCWACLRKDDLLQTTIATLSKKAASAP